MVAPGRLPPFGMKAEWRLSQEAKRRALETLEDYRETMDGCTGSRPGVVVVRILDFFFVGSVVVEYAPGHVVVLGAVVLLLFAILALIPWRWEGAGGLLLVVMSLFIGVTYAIASAAIVRRDGSRLPLAVRVITTVVFTGPPLVAGILFLLHRRSVKARA